MNVDLALLSESAVNDRIIVNLFENVFYTVVLDQKEESSPDSFTWYAHIPELPNSHVIMVVGGNQLAANIQSKDEIYQVRYAGAEDLHVIYQIDQSAFPSEDEPRMDE